MQEHPYVRLRFVWITLPPRLDPWSPQRGEQGLRLHYIVWQHLAKRAASRIHFEHGLDLTHHVSWGTLSAPPLLWQLRVPFVWGPVGGGQTAPRAFRTYFGRAWRTEVARSLRVTLLPFVPSVRQAARGTALTLATNRDTSTLLERAGARRLELLPDAGVDPADRPARPPHRGAREELTLLWAGRLERRKALPLALEALAQVPDMPVRLLVAGSGPLANEWQALTSAMHLQDRVRFLGRVSRSDMTELFDSADAFVFTSLRDSFGAVVLEAMARGLPILALNHQGVRDIVPRECGVMVSVTTPRETVAGLAEGIQLLATSPEARRRMTEAAWQTAGKLTWGERARQLDAWYKECLKDSRS